MHLYPPSSRRSYAKIPEVDASIATFAPSGSSLANSSKLRMSLEIYLSSLLFPRRLPSNSSSTFYAVIKEIESWYLAGLDNKVCRQLKINNFADTDNITKEKFSRVSRSVEIIKNPKGDTSSRLNVEEVNPNGYYRLSPNKNNV